MLRPNAPCFASTEELRLLKREKRRYRTHGLEIHRQMYNEKCLKEHIDLLAAPITSIVNESLNSGVQVPDSLKEGEFSTDWEAFSPYRPITNIAFLSKPL